MRVSVKGSDTFHLPSRPMDANPSKRPQGPIYRRWGEGGAWAWVHVRGLIPSGNKEEEIYIYICRVDDSRTVVASRKGRKEDVYVCVYVVYIYMCM